MCMLKFEFEERRLINRIKCCVNKTLVRWTNLVKAAEANEVETVSKKPDWIHLASASFLNICEQAINGWIVSYGSSKLCRISLLSVFSFRVFKRRSENFSFTLNELSCRMDYNSTSRLERCWRRVYQMISEWKVEAKEDDHVTHFQLLHEVPICDALFGWIWRTSNFKYKYCKRFAYP